MVLKDKRETGISRKGISSFESKVLLEEKRDPRMHTKDTRYASVEGRVLWLMERETCIHLEEHMVSIGLPHHL